MSQERNAKKQEAELTPEQLEDAAGGAGFMYFKDSPIVGEVTDEGRSASTDIVAGDDDTSQAIGTANGGVWKTTNGGSDW